MRASPSSVLAALCGETTTLGSFHSACVASEGSDSSTSVPKPCSRPARSASTSARSSTTGPRAVLTRIAPGLRAAKAASFIRWRVAGVSGQCSVTTSLAASATWRSRAQAKPSAAMRAGWKPGSITETFMWKARQ